ncbi:LysR family transcriptional regulator [Aeromicrobium wangtongii]|uniref:LysR family transcriptional regulator n=1 Tax=Aeromicrobium wangtongii TaxID=2969247 RepID=A0ABY5M9T7_9ACTN|nr:LysR family transcriptional regulator [Aeromicrobium wangtongii]MCD9199528.1 LysR family transcriptional regulator [Aeromicrobium wangtongii]UUP13881.1 LysR family transcriptional regulator [Aeromicrobium wangtongii]
MELRTLGYFVAVADAGSVSAAAAVVHVTQPAISRQLRQLETELGLELFTRGPGRLSLTAAGQQFLPHARDVLHRADEARAAARTYAAGRLERLTIAAPTTTLTDVIAPFLATLTDDDPMPTVFESDPREAYPALRHGADLAIVTEAPRSTLAARALASLPVWAYVRDDHPWHGRDAVALHELVDETVLALTPSFRPRQILDTALARLGVPLDRVVDCSNPQVAQALAAAGRGVAVVTDDARFGLWPVQIVGRDGPLRIDLFAAWEPEHHAAETLAALAARLGEFCVERYGPDVAPAGHVGQMGREY